MIRKCTSVDFNSILLVINDGASAYRGVIPADRWHEPYMSENELRKQLTEGVEFWAYEQNGSIAGVMGIQFKGEVTLIRHAYVRTAERQKGVGKKLLNHLLTQSSTPILIGTWADASWAIDFYQKNGFSLLSKEETMNVLPRYWNIPARQVETSVVLASQDWFQTHTRTK